MTPSSCYERRLSGVIVVVLPVYFLFEPYFFTPWPSPENSTQFCLAAFDVPVASPPPHFTIYFYPVKSEQKRKKRERVKIQKKLAFPSVYRRTSLALFSLLVNISNQDASSGRVSYFTFFFDIGFLFFLSGSPCYCALASKDGLPTAVEKEK